MTPPEAPRVAARGRLLDDEAALAPTGTITAFLTICAFIRPSTSVRKSSRRSDQRQAAAGDPPAAQVDALGARRVDEDLERGPRVREPDELGRVELERHVWLRLATLLAALEEVRAQHRAHHGEEAAQDLVLVEALDGVDRLLDSTGDRLGRPSSASAGSKRARNRSISIDATSGWSTSTCST